MSHPLGIPSIRRGAGLNKPLLVRLVRWWSGLPDRQLTRRGLRELSSHDIEELGLVRNRIDIDVLPRRR